MFISLCIIGIIIFVCNNLRHCIINQTIARYNISQQLLIQNILLDVIGAIELCGVSLQLGVVFKHYGFWSFALLLYANVFYQCMRWPNLPPPCPYFHIVNFISGKPNNNTSIVIVVIRCIVLLASGLFAYHFIITSIWRWELSETHFGRIKETSTDQCSVPGGPNENVICLLVLSEFIGTLLLDVVIKILVVDNPFFQRRDSPIIKATIISGLVVFAVSLAMDVSGGMFNPMLATVLVGGCNGHTITEHILIYWVSPTMGAVSASFIYPKIKRFIYTTTSTVKTSKASKKKKQ